MEIGAGLGKRQPCAAFAQALGPWPLVLSRELLPEVPRQAVGRSASRWVSPGLLRLQRVKAPGLGPTEPW